MTRTQASELRTVWCGIDSGYPFYVVAKNGEYLCEGPNQRLDLAAGEVDEETESCIRLFPSHAHATAYAGVWRELLEAEPGNNQLKVIKATVEEIWNHIDAIDSNSFAEFGVSARLDICKLNEFKTPICIHTLRSESKTAH